MSALASLLDKLDLLNYTNSLTSFFARPKSFVLEGDKLLHYSHISALDDIQLPQLPKIDSIEDAILKLGRFGVLSEIELGTISQISSYFDGLKSIEFKEPVKNWIQTIIVPDQVKELKPFFDKDKKIKSEADEALYKIDLQLKTIKSEISSQISKVLHTQKLQSYFVDRQVHFVNDEECLLLRPGFNVLLRGQIVGRSATGFFYVVPQSVTNLKEKYSDLVNERTHIIWKICKKLSESLYKCVSFIKYIDRQFDKLDHYIARIEFAKAKDYIFVRPNDKKEVSLVEFCHPSLEKPKPITVNLDKQIALVTGVNAGGKTMLLKSILSAALMAKYLLPMRAHNSSKIGSFSYVNAIVNDPQDVKLDISTFAGRAKEIAELFSKKDSLIGIDEIELGTDSDEAAALFSVALLELVKKGHYIVVTTHHKKLAALLSGSEYVKLVAALYDESIQKPKFEFLTGTIGKSYAFETAKRYGMPSYVIENARKEYGEDQAKLNDLIEQSVSLQASMKQKLEDITKLENTLLKRQDELDLLRQKQEQEFSQIKFKLESSYSSALNEAKEAAKKCSTEDIHKGMNSANIEIVKARTIKYESKKEPIALAAGMTIKWRNRTYQIASIDSKNVILDDDGKRLKTQRAIIEKEAIRVTKDIKKQKDTKIVLARPDKCAPLLDLHGYYVEDALEELDKYLSDAVLANFKEVQIMHGVGSGKLAVAVKNFLKSHPVVKNMEDAALKNGGAGSSIVWL